MVSDFVESSNKVTKSEDDWNELTDSKIRTPRESRSEQKKENLIVPHVMGISATQHWDKKEMPDEINGLGLSEPSSPESEIVYPLRRFATPTGEIEIPVECTKFDSVEVNYFGTSGGIGKMVEVDKQDAKELDIGWDYWMDTEFDIQKCWNGSQIPLKRPLTGCVNAVHYGEVQVNTMYKRKADKVQPVNKASEDGAIPGGAENCQTLVLANHYPNFNRERDGLFHRRLATFQRGTRLTAERLEKVNIGMELNTREKELFHEVLFRREGCLGWNFSDVGRIREEVSPDQRIKTVEHQAWQERGFKVPLALKPKVIAMLKERMKNGIMERCEGPYRNPWFLVPKKNGDFRLIIGATKMNSVTRRDANMPPNCDEFAEDFGGCAVTSLVDLFSGYDQMILSVLDRDITAIMTPLGLLRMTRIVQGGTNSVAQFVRVISKILEDIMPDVCRVFLDDIGIKGPRTRYDDELSPDAPGCRRYIVEHLINIDTTLFLLELAGATISVEKSQFLCNGLKIVGWVCDFDGHKAEGKKVDKIVNWPRPQNIRDIRSFVSTASYFRVLIREFQWIAAPLYEVTRSKNSKFYWNDEQQEAFDQLKEILSSNPVVLPLDYEADPLNIIVAVDASLQGWGAVLMQNQRGRRHPARYESGIWTPAESEYDAGKREARAVLKALKKFKSFLYGVHFTLEVDSETVVAQLNRSATDLPGALVNQWLAWIRLFDFTVRHVKGTKHGAPDGLSRRPPSPTNSSNESLSEEDFDARILADLSLIVARINPLVESESDRILDAIFSDESEKIARWLTRLQKPPGLVGSSLTAFKKKACKHLVQDDQLYRRRRTGEQPALVIDDLERRRAILRACHEELGHRGRESTYHHIKRRYHWEGLYLDVVKHIKTCPECQARDPVRIEEPLQATMMSQLFRRINMDVTYMPPADGKSLLVVARDDLSHWVEARPLRANTSKAVAQFFYEDIICRHGVPYEVRIDGGPENQGELRTLLERMRIKIIKISPYNSKAAGNIEVGHKTIQAALAKITKGTGKLWTRHLPSVLFADRTTVKHSTGRTPYELLYGEQAVLPIECEVPTWQTRNWLKIRNTADLLATRARQIERRDADLVEAAHRLERMRERNQEYFDNTHTLRLKPLEVNNLVLLHNTKLDKELTSDRKLQYRWVGPYVIHAAYPNGTYKLRELDGAVRQDTIHGNRLKQYYVRPDETPAILTDSPPLAPENITNLNDNTGAEIPTTRESGFFSPDTTTETPRSEIPTTEESEFEPPINDELEEQHTPSTPNNTSERSLRPRKSVTFAEPLESTSNFSSLSGRESDTPPRRMKFFRAIEIPVQHPQKR